MVPILPPSALALASLPGSGPPSLPEGSGPRTAPHGLNLLALLQSTGSASGLPQRMSLQDGSAISMAQ